MKWCAIFLICSSSLIFGGCTEGMQHSWHKTVNQIKGHSYSDTARITGIPQTFQNWHAIDYTPYKPRPLKKGLLPQTPLQSHCTWQERVIEVNGYRQSTLEPFCPNVSIAPAATR